MNLSTSSRGGSQSLPLVLCAFFAALTAVLSQIALPLPFTPVPISLATLSVLLAGGLLGPFWGCISQVVYIFIGACGLPVFSGFSGGFAILAGPTGGYIIGYAAAAAISGLFTQHVSTRHRLFLPILAAAMLLGTAACYFLGTLWFMYQTHTGLIPSLLACVVPFLPGDILKILLSCTLVRIVKRALPLFN